MASAQVMSNNSGVSARKQEHLEAGKRRLEEFRKKKAAAKKAVSTSQFRSSVSSVVEKKSLENGQAQCVDSTGAAAEGRTDSLIEASGSFEHNDKLYGSANASGSDSISVTQPNSESLEYISSSLLQMQPKQAKKNDGNLGFESHTSYIGSSAGRNAPQYDHTNIFHSALYGVDASQSNNDINSSQSTPETNVSANNDAAYSMGHATNLLLNDEPGPKHHAMDGFTSNVGLGGMELKKLTSGLEDRKPADSMAKFLSFYSQQASQPSSAGFEADGSGSINGSLSSHSETYPRRSRPSFLDTLNIGRESLASGQSFLEKEKNMSSNLPNNTLLSSSAIHNQSPLSASAEPLATTASSTSRADFLGNEFRGQKSFENSLESREESNFSFQKQNEDFSALEQHIEDLTQEKFSLQRALEASKALAESLAAENSSLTESYNHQASIVNQLKAEMENLQGEIKARLVELESFKAEYMNAQLECNAADERAKLLASEVIGLEEKALRLRSNELKMERELENSSAEMASYKKRLSSLEKERLDLSQTIDALQEEKKLLQSKFRKASATGASIDNKGCVKKDVSTTTNDLGCDIDRADQDSVEQASSSLQTHEDSGNLLSLVVEKSAMSIPPDQMQMIQSIKSLISEITAEKEELMQALVTEVSTSTKLKDLNKELSRKLEMQTQRLELLTAQSMANENIQARQSTSSLVVRESMAYADEGDEVVERVLGWIMKLFPGGPSKRRTSSRF